MRKFVVWCWIIGLLCALALILVIGRASSQAGASALRRWTTPADRPLGDRVAAYDLRFSKAPIDSVDPGRWENFSGVPIPAAPGAPDSCLVTGLEYSTVYGFAIRSRDKAGNWSAWSNIVVDTTDDRTGPDRILDFH